MEDQLQRKHQAAAASIDVDLRTLQFDVAEKNKVRTGPLLNILEVII